MDTTSKQIPTQKNLSDVAKSIVSNINAASEIVDAALRSVNIIIECNYINKATSYKIELTKNVLLEYSNMILEIVNVYSSENSNGKNVDEILGRIKKYDKDKDAEVTGYTTIDTVYALTKMVSFVVEEMQKIGSVKTLIKIYIASKLSKLVINAVGEFIVYLNKSLSDKKLSNLPDLSKLIKLIKQINDLSKALLLCALIAIPATIAIMVVSLYMVALVLFIKIVNYIFRNLITDEISEEILEGVDRLRKILLVTLLIGITLVMIAILTPAIILAMVVVSLLFFAFVALVKVIEKAAESIDEVAGKALKQMIKGCLALTLIFMVLLVASIAMLLLAVTAVLIDKMDAVLPIIGLLLGIIIIGTVMVAVGAGLTLLIEVIGPCLVGLVALATVFVVLAITAISMLILALVAWALEKLDGASKITSFILDLIPIVLSLTLLSVVIIPFALLSPLLISGLISVAVVMVELIVLSILILVLGAISMLLEKMNAYELVNNFITELMLTALLLSGLGVELVLMTPILLLAIAGMVTFAGLLASLVVIATEITTLSKLELDKNSFKKIEFITESAIGFCAYLLALISGSEKVRFNGKDYEFGALSFLAAYSCKSTLGRIEDIVESLYDVAEELKELQELDIKGSKIERQVTTVFGLVMLVKELVNDFNKKYNSGGLFDGWFEPDEEDAGDTINAIKGVIENLKSVAEALNSLLEVKIKAQKITKRIDELFEIVDVIKGKIDIFNEKYNSGWFDGWFEADDEDALESLEVVTDIVKCLQDTAKTLNTIMDIKIKRDKIIKRVDDMFELVSHIKTKITEYNEKHNNSSWWDSLWGSDEEDAMESINAVTEVVNCLKITAEALSAITKIKLKKDKINERVDDIFGYVISLKNRIAELNKADSGGRGGLAGWWNRRKARKRMEEQAEQFGQIAQVVSALDTVQSALSGIEKIKINKDKVNEKIVDIFGFIKDVKARIIALNKADEGNAGGGLGGLIRGWWNKRKAKQNLSEGTEQIGQIAEVVGAMHTIAEALNLIQELNLDKNNINNKIIDIFSYVKTVKRLIKDLAKSDTPDVKKLWWWEIRRANEAKKAEQRNFEEGAEQMSIVAEVVGELNTIVDALNKIQDIKFDAQGIKKKLTYIFAFAKFVQKQIIAETEASKIKSSGSSFNNFAMTVSKKAYEQKMIADGQASLESANETLALLNSIIDPLKAISDIKLNKNRVMNKLKNIFSTVNSIQDAIMEFGEEQKIKTDEMNKSNTSGSIEDAMEPIFETIDEINKRFDTLSKIDSDKLTKNFKSGAKFINTVNKINVEKAKTVTNLFEKMTNFAQEIDGNFEGLAEALGDKLVPVLKDLKDIMEQIPGKLDTGFQNTSASIAAASAPPTAENMADQVNRENPNLSQAEKDEIVKNRMADSAKQESTGVAAKLDELLDLLKGYSGKRVVVKTI